MKQKPEHGGVMKELSNKLLKGLDHAKAQIFVFFK